jgi:hypothetical protein
LKWLAHLGLLGVVFPRRLALLQTQHGGIGMNSKVLSCLIAGTLSATLALASPVLARGGGGGGHGGGGGGGGMRAGGMGGGMHFSGMSGAHFSGMHAMSGMHVSSGRFATASFAHSGLSHRSSRIAFHDHDHFGRHHHRFHRFAFIGAPYAYASYDNCWRRAWTPYGLQWVNVCGDYGY